VSTALIGTFSSGDEQPEVKHHAEGTGYGRKTDVIIKARNNMPAATYGTTLRGQASVTQCLSSAKIGSAAPTSPKQPFAMAPSAGEIAYARSVFRNRVTLRLGDPRERHWVRFG
jgi:hypothetical protein